MTRRDYFDELGAPEANCVVPAANVVVTDDEGRILIIRRTDNGNHALPGGGLELGESLPGTAVRETKEETGLDVEITGLVGIYTDPRHLIEYTSNGEVRQEFAVVFTARPVGGQVVPTDEASEVIWVQPDDLRPWRCIPRCGCASSTSSKVEPSPTSAEWSADSLEGFGSVGGEAGGGFSVGHAAEDEGGEGEADRGPGC